MRFHEKLDPLIAADPARSRLLGGVGSVPLSAREAEARARAADRNKSEAERERDLLRAFRARLFDKQMELAHLKRKKDESAASWIARSPRASRTRGASRRAS